MLAGVAAQHGVRFVVAGAFLFLGQPGQIPRVVQPVAHELPVARGHRFGNGRVVVEYRHVQRHRAGNLPAVEHFEHAPEADPVAVVVVAELAHVRVRGPGIGIDRALGRQVLVMLDVGHHPDGDPGVVGPRRTGAIDDGVIRQPVVDRSEVSLVWPAHRVPDGSGLLRRPTTPPFGCIQMDAAICIPSFRCSRQPRRRHAGPARSTSCWTVNSATSLPSRSLRSRAVQTTVERPPWVTSASVRMTSPAEADPTSWPLTAVVA